MIVFKAKPVRLLKRLCMDHISSYFFIVIRKALKEFNLVEKDSYILCIFPSNTQGR